MKKLMKKTLSILLTLILSVSLCTVAFAANGHGAYMQSYSSVSTEDFHAEQYVGKIERIVFLDFLKETFPDNVSFVADFDLSLSSETGEVLAKLASSDYGRLTLYIGGQGGVVAPEDSSYLFADTGVKTIEGIEKFDTSLVTNMKGMFSGCKLTEFDLDVLDLSDVTDVSYMFAKCNVLQSITAENTDTSKVKSFIHMFDGCTALSDLSLKNIDLGSTYNIDHMFYGCLSLEEADLSTWKNTSSVSSINAFRNCTALRSVNLDGWDLSSIRTLDGVFAYCNSLQEVSLCGITPISEDVFSSSMSNPIEGVTELTVHTDNIDFTDSLLWTEFFSKATDVKVSYKVTQGADVYTVTFMNNENVEYYIVSIDGDTENAKTVYGGASIDLAKGRTVSVQIKAVEGASPLKLNVNGTVMDFGDVITVEGDTIVTIQYLHDTEPIEPDPTVNALTRVIYAIRDFFNSIIRILEGFFGRFTPWLD